jgi:hypothetical protein
MTWKIVVALECAGCDALITADGDAGRPQDLREAKELIGADAINRRWKRLKSSKSGKSDWYCRDCAAILRRRHLAQNEEEKIHVED